MDKCEKCGGIDFIFVKNKRKKFIICKRCFAKYKIKVKRR
jgi:hypothetical protein